MKLLLVRYECASCAGTFEAPIVGPYTSCGTFLLRSSTGAARYLDAFQDETYKEVGRLLKAHEKTSRLSDSGYGKALQRIYGEIACDGDADGNPFIISAYPVCPVCKSQEMAYWEFKAPPEFIDVALEHVTHNKWNSLSEDEKLRLLSKQLESNPHRYGLPSKS